jgi:hypothetical protein
VLNILARAFGPCALCCLFLSAMTPVAASTADASLAARCPAQIGLAIDAADTAAFEKLVDIDAILNEGFNIFLRDLEAMQEAGDIPPLLALLFSPAAMRNAAGEQIRALLVNETKAFVLNGVASGAFAGRPPDGRAAQGLLAPLFADASTGRKEIRNIGVPRGKNGEWLVPFVVHDLGNGESYPVVGRLSPAHGQCRLTAIENLDELIHRINEERKNREE